MCDNTTLQKKGWLKGKLSLQKKGSVVSEKAEE
jgi:hypothetical protein